MASTDLPESRRGDAHTEERLRVLLVEDSPPLAERIAELIKQLGGVEFVASVASENAALDSLARGVADAIVLDLNLQQGNGFGVLRAIRQRALPVAVVVFTSYDIPAYRRAAAALGAAEFLHKARDYDKLPGVLERLAKAHLDGARVDSAAPPP